MTLRRGLVNAELPMRVPEGFADETRYLEKDDTPKLTTYRVISRRAIEEARWLAQRTDGATATAPYHDRVSEMAGAFHVKTPAQNVVEGGLREMALEGQIEEVIAKIVEGSLEIPSDFTEDQIEDWILYKALEKPHA